MKRMYGLVFVSAAIVLGSLVGVDVVAADSITPTNSNVVTSPSDGNTVSPTDGNTVSPSNGSTSGTNGTVSPNNSGSIQNCAPDTNGNCKGGSVITAKDYVCVKFAINNGGMSQGRCPSGQYEVPNSTANGGAIVFYLKQILILCSWAVGFVVVLMIIVSGIQYITSAADPVRVKSAKNRLEGAIIALFLFLIMFAAITFLLPEVF